MHSECSSYALIRYRRLGGACHVIFNSLTIKHNIHFDPSSQLGMQKAPLIDMLKAFGKHCHISSQCLNMA